uniref:Uncharacterized protein n=1 Tax=Coccidioides posadasii RMSCC 3488 TaxID=454284 RepID=A0A0J6F3P6_COCPO|nr:hypothetical protein CPAG_00253 [Coccidioides posadasii RMSCC 3488]
MNWPCTAAKRRAEDFYAKLASPSAPSVAQAQFVKKTLHSTFVSVGSPMALWREQGDRLGYVSEQQSESSTTFPKERNLFVNETLYGTYNDRIRLSENSGALRRMHFGAYQVISS